MKYYPLLLVLLLSFTSLFAQSVKRDGRFCLGSGQSALLFGYPNQFGGSYFTIACGSSMASNSPNFYHMRHLRTPPLIEFAEGTSPSSSVEYAFCNVEITQEITPLDKHRKPIEGGKKSASFYEVKYTFLNNSHLDKDLRFSLFLDLAHGHDDFATVSTATAPLENNTPLLQEGTNSLPHLLNVSYKSGQKLAVDLSGNTHLPSGICAGDWNFLNNINDFTTIAPTTYPIDDVALSIRWEKLTLESFGESSIKIIIGHESLQNLKLQHHKQLSPKEITLYFDKGSSTLNAKEKQKILAFLKDQKVTASLVEGYTDASGDAKLNLKLSRSRIAAVRTILLQHNVKKSNILEKSHGEFYSTEYVQEAADLPSPAQAQDRKVTLTIWQ